jgi:hypothetical protein
MARLLGIGEGAVFGSVETQAWRSSNIQQPQSPARQRCFQLYRWRALPARSVIKEWQQHIEHNSLSNTLCEYRYIYRYGRVCQSVEILRRDVSRTQWYSAWKGAHTASYWECLLLKEINHVHSKKKNTTKAAFNQYYNGSNNFFNCSSISPNSSY